MRRSMRAADIDALVILSPSNLEYLTGIDLVDFQPMETSQGIGKLIYVSEDSAEFIYYAVTSPGIMNTVTWLDHVVYDQPEDPASVVARRISSGVRTLGVEGSFLPHNLSKRLEATLPAVELVDATRLVYELRMVKSDEEVSRVRRSARIADLAMVDVLPNIYGMREVDVAAGRDGVHVGARRSQRCLLPHRVLRGAVRRRDLRRDGAKDRPGRLRDDRSGRQVQGLPLRLHPHLAFRTGARRIEEGPARDARGPELQPWV